MIKTKSLFQRGARNAGLFVSLLFACVFLEAAAPGARAQAGVFVANAIKHAIIHKISSSHLDRYNSPLDGNKMMEIVPEPGTPTLLALGGFVGLVAWRLRRRSTPAAVPNKNVRG